MFDNNQILALAQLPESCFRFKIHIDNLIGFYRYLKEAWTTAAIDDFKRANNLDLRKPLDRARMGWLAAKEWVACLPPAPQTETQRETQVVKVLCQAIALLPPCPPTNSLEDAPAYRILGRPIYLDELLANYRTLAQKWHPDASSHPEAQGRFQLITQIFKEMRSQWMDKYSPLIPAEKIGSDNLKLAYAKRFPWTPESFWQ